MGVIQAAAVSLTTSAARSRTPRIRAAQPAHKVSEPPAPSDCQYQSSANGDALISSRQLSHRITLLAGVCVRGDSIEVTGDLNPAPPSPCLLAALLDRIAETLEITLYTPLVQT